MDLYDVFFFFFFLAGEDDSSSVFGTDASLGGWVVSSGDGEAASDLTVKFSSSVDGCGSSFGASSFGRI
jgi:hypothetical protein